MSQKRNSCLWGQCQVLPGRKNELISASRDSYLFEDRSDGIKLPCAMPDVLNLFYRSGLKHAVSLTSTKTGPASCLLLAARERDETAGRQVGEGGRGERRNEEELVNVARRRRRRISTAWNGR
eukprot:761511-Hanusia_phi.AAC.1